MSVFPSRFDQQFGCKLKVLTALACLNLTKQPSTLKVSVVLSKLSVNYTWSKLVKCLAQDTNAFT